MRSAPRALTPTERRVVELALEGRTNREIAAALGIAVKTVETHLTHAFQKLRVRSRKQLARQSQPLGLSLGRETSRIEPRDSLIGGTTSTFHVRQRRLGRESEERGTR